MDKNIFAIVANGMKTVKVKFEQMHKDSREFGWFSNEYTYVTNLDVKVGEFVVVHVGNNPTQKAHKVALVVTVDEGVDIQPNCDIEYKFVVGKVDDSYYYRLMDQKEDVEKELAKAYQQNIRKQFAQQFLGNANPELLAKLGYSKD